MKPRNQGVTKKAAKRPGRKGGERLSSPRRVAAKERVAQAIKLRIAGAQFGTIADALGYADAAAAWNAVMRALQAVVREPATELISLELERLDALFLSSFPMAQRGVLTAVDRCIKIMERRARLLGLDLPQQVEISGRDGGPVKVTEVLIRGSADSKPT